VNEPSPAAVEADETAIAPGVSRFGTKRVNWYLVEGDDGVLVVDAGVPGHWPQLLSALADRGYGLDDVAALVLTHGHADHVGFAERLRETAAVPVFVHEADVGLAQGAEDVSVGDALVNLWRPAVLALLFELGRNGGLSIPPVEEVRTFADGDVLDLPGSPKVVHVPGHSPGSCVFFLPDREVLLCGDALATLDLTTGRERGPQIMSLFNADADRARASLDRFADLGRVTLLPGHGRPWRGEMDEAVRLARSQ